MRTKVAIIGAGPYGLSLAAHLRGAGIDFRNLRPPDGCVAKPHARGHPAQIGRVRLNLYDPDGEYPLARFCHEKGIEYDDQRLPVRLDTFVDYGRAFGRRFAAELKETLVASVARAPGGFSLKCDNGEVVDARRVVVAAGIGPFRFLPGVLARLDPKLVSHSYDHRDLDRFAGQRVAVIGAGSSAIDLAGLLRDHACDVQLICRADALKFGSAPSRRPRSAWRRLRHPPSGLGPGWRSRFCTDAPLVFHALPVALRLRIVKRHLGPAASWRMREKIDGRVPVLSGHELVDAAAEGDGVRVSLRQHGGACETAIFDHVIAATGYRVDIRRLDFIDAALRAEIACVDETPILSTRFEILVRRSFLCRARGGEQFRSADAVCIRRGLRGPSDPWRAETVAKRCLAGGQGAGARAVKNVVLIAHSLAWPNAARLAIAFRKAGFVVEAIAPEGHPVHRMLSPDRTFVYRPWRPRKSLRRAIEASQPRLIIPCDDRIVMHLHALHAQAPRFEGPADPSSISTLVETSLGSPKAFDFLAKRRSLGQLSGLPEVHIPRTDEIGTVRALKDWAAAYGLPALLKLDGSTGGKDVVLVTDRAALVPSFLQMMLRRSGVRRLRDALLRNQVEPLVEYFRNGAPAVSVQSFVAGPQANCSVACWRGEALASIAVEVVRARSRFGVATVVRPVEGQAMKAAARSIVRHLQLSGFCGFDFILDEASGRPHLIEINPRATQICHLPPDLATDLPRALRRALDGQSAEAEAALTPPSGEVALFPQEWLRDRNSAYLAGPQYDVPYEEPDFVRFYGFEPPRRSEEPKSISERRLEGSASPV